MNRPVLFQPAAERELLEAERWFEERQTDHGDKRRAIVPHFPYALYSGSSTSISSSPEWCMGTATPPFGNPSVEA